MEALKRSVDSLEKIYAVIIALAIGRAVQSIVEVSAVENVFRVQIPAIITFFVILVPFYHGMNRHLDRCYIEKKDKYLQGALILDFIVFSIEASLLLVFAIKLKDGMECFIYIGILLIFDALWALISHWIHYKGYGPSVRRWSIINLITLPIGIGIYLTNSFSIEFKPWMILIIALARTTADYIASWGFYFPDKYEDNRHEEKNAVPKTP